MPYEIDKDDAVYASVRVVAYRDERTLGEAREFFGSLQLVFYSKSFEQDPCELGSSERINLVVNVG